MPSEAETTAWPNERAACLLKAAESPNRFISVIDSSSPISRDVFKDRYRGEPKLSAFESIELSNSPVRERASLGEPLPKEVCNECTFEYTHCHVHVSPHALRRCADPIYIAFDLPERSAPAAISVDLEYDLD